MMASTTTWMGFWSVRRWMISSVLDDADGHELLAGVAALLHEAAGKTLNDGAGGLAESLLLVATGGVGKEGGVVTSAGDVVL